MPDIDRFIQRAQNLGATHILAPETVSSALKNLGSLAGPDSTLQSGAVLASPGLVGGSVIAKLDGENDYISTPWKTRTNLCIQPSPEVANTQWTGTARFFNNAATVTRDTATTQFDGVGCWKVVCPGVANVEGFAITTNIACTLGVSYTFSIYLKGNAGGEQVKLSIGSSEAGQTAGGIVTLTKEWQRYSVTFVCTKTSTFQWAVTGPASLKAQTFYADCALVEESASMGSYFPLVSELTSGVCGWSGTANESQADQGPFARGTQRTFVCIAERTSTELDGYFASNINGLYVQTTNEYRFRINGSDVNLGVTAPTSTGRQVLAVTFDSAAEALKFYVNGAPTASKTTALKFSPTGSVTIGTALGQFTKGSFLPFAIFPTALSERNVELLYRSAIPVPKRKRRKPDLALDIEVETPDAVYRLPADSRKAKNLPRNLTIGSTRGEGFGIGGLNLSRAIFKEWPDIGLLDSWRAVSRTGDISYEGRLQSDPRTNDPEELIEIALIGWASYLTGKKISPLIIDPRLGGWQDPTLGRKSAILNGTWTGAGGNRYESSEITASDVSGEFGPGIVQRLGQVTAGTTPVREAWFYAGGESIGKLLFDARQLIAGFGEDGNMNNTAFLSTDDLATTIQGGTDYNQKTALQQTLSAAGSTAFKWALFQMTYGASLATSDYKNAFAWCFPKVVGTHGLELHGTWPEVGFYMTDIIRFLLEMYRPKIKLAGEFNDFVVQQATWHDNSATLYDIIKQLNNLALWELNVFEKRTLYHERADLTKYDWQFKTTDDGVKVKFQGDSIENFANGCSVHYTGFDGLPHALYPSDHPELRDESEDNPYNKHGEDGWTDCDVPYQCDESEALQFGRVYLAEFNRPKRPGVYEIQGGYIKDSVGQWHQGWKPRNGETVGIMDLISDEPRLITSAIWDDETKVLTITVDAPDKLLDAIVAREQIARETRAL